MTLHAALLVAGLALGAPVAAIAQSDRSEPPAQPTLRTFVTDLGGDFRRLPSNQASVSVAIGGIVAASLSPLDDKVLDWEPGDGWKAGQWIGNPFVLAGSTLAAYGVGHWTDKPQVRHVADDALRAQVVAATLTFGLKYATRRERPDQTSADSFPSGHASGTFATATVLTRHLGVKAAIPAYATAAFVSVSRINQHRHWVSDVAFGAGLGVAAGWNGQPHTGKWSFAPAVGRSQVALNVSRVFAP